MSFPKVSFRHFSFLSSRSLTNYPHSTPCPPQALLLSLDVHLKKIILDSFPQIRNQFNIKHLTSDKVNWNTETHKVEATQWPCPMS